LGRAEEKEKELKQKNAEEKPFSVSVLSISPKDAERDRSERLFGFVY